MRKGGPVGAAFSPAGRECALQQQHLSLQQSQLSQHSLQSQSGQSHLTDIV